MNSDVSKFDVQLTDFLDQNHPDTSANKSTSENAANFRNIVEAYNVLGKADSRAVYDAVMNREEGSFKHSYAGWVQTLYFKVPPLKTALK